ncbi:MAG: carboxypeptidase-like regulatory domain-containing protein [Lepagella sp.]
MMKKIAFVLLLTVCTLLPAVAQNVKISGKILDQEDKPIEFGTVRIAGTAVGTNTNLDGAYTLSIAPRDTLELIYTAIGYRTVKRTLIDAKGELTINVKMLPEDHMLDEVQVQGYRPNSQGMQHVDVDNLRVSPDVSGGSVESVIGTMAGVVQNNEMSSQYQVRGGSFDENSVYINGIELYRPQLISNGQQEGLSVINPDMVGAINFSTGGFSARYSDKMSSVLDITYREPQAFEGAVSASLMGGSIMIGQNSGKFSQMHGARLKKNNSLLSSLDSKGEYDPTFFDYQLNMTYKPSENISVNLLGNINLNHYNFKPHDRETSFGIADDVKKFKVYFDGEEKDRFETYLGALSVTWRPSQAFTLQTGGGAFLTNELVSYDISGEYWLDQAGTSGNGGVGGEQGVGKYMEHSRNRLRASVLQFWTNARTQIGRQNLSIGLQYQHETFRDRSREWEWRDSAGYSLPTAPPGVHLLYNLSSRQDVVTNRIAFFAQDTYYLNTDAAFLTFNAGVRVSYWDFNKETLISPRFNFSLNPAAHDRWTFRAAFGWYYQSPFFKEYRQAVQDDLGNGSVVLNRDIKSPRSIQVILGTDYTFRALDRPFKLTAEAYYKNIARMISYEYDNLKVNYSGANDSKGYIMGLDLRFFGQFVEGSDSWVSFSLMKTQQDLAGKKMPMPSDHRYSVALFFTDYFPKFPKLKFALRGIFSDGLTMVPPRQTRDKVWFRAPAYKRVDIGLSYQIVGSPKGEEPRRGWLKDLNIGLDLFNLFDISNVSSYYWITDVNNIQYAVPNYLTRRQLNVRLSMQF